MKKLIAFVLTLAMATITSVTAFAVDTTITPDSDPKTGSTAVEYSVDSTYTVTIPSEVTLGNSFEIKAENVVLEQGKQLEVALTATSGAGNAFTVSNGKTGELTYEVKVGETPVSVGDKVLTVNPTTASAGSATLNFSSPPTSTIVYAGNYIGTVTFTVSVADEA